jgi:hypothetical protein
MDQSHAHPDAQALADRHFNAHRNPHAGGRGMKTCRQIFRFEKYWKAWGLILILWAAPGGKSGAQNELLTIPVIAADYYGWAYTEIFEDRADVFGWSTAGVDALGWTVLFAGRDSDAGLKLVNLAGWAKTLYPAVTLIWVPDAKVRNRAWIAAGTHAATLITLEFLGQPAIGVSSSMGPNRDCMGVKLAWGF